jgi:hypothetical protein
MILNEFSLIVTEDGLFVNSEEFSELVYLVKSTPLSGINLLYHPNSEQIDV